MPGRLRPTEAIPLLEEFWDLDGYFFKLRHGDYEAGGAERLQALLTSIEVSDETDLPRRLVSLTWMIPMFMEWQVERVREKSGDTEALKRDIDRLRNTLNEFLGFP
jgi:hypothetical protein